MKRKPKRPDNPTAKDLLKAADDSGKEHAEKETLELYELTEKALSEHCAVGGWQYGKKQFAGWGPGLLETSRRLRGE